MTADNKTNLTILLPSWNEESIITETIQYYKDLGYEKILVLDDNSTDETRKRAEESGAMVMRNSHTGGFTLTALRGLYSVTTPGALIIDPDNRPTAEQLTEFLEFGIMGHYGLLISKFLPKRPLGIPDVSKYLKRRFGIFLKDPDFEVVFINKSVLDDMKTSPVLTDEYLYFSLIALAIHSKQKVGTYTIGPSSIFTAPYLARLILRLRQRDGHKSHSEYFKYVFPDMQRAEFNQKIALIILGAIIGGLVTYVTQALTTG